MTAKQAIAMRIATESGQVSAGRNVLGGSRYTVNRSTIDALVRRGLLVPCLSGDGGMAARLPASDDAPPIGYMQGRGAA